MGRKRREKFRGYRTHGRGKKAGRGKGKRGGHGRAGYHKHKFIYMLKYEPDHFGRHGFTRHGTAVPEVKTINISEVIEMLDAFSMRGIAKKEKNIWHVDLSALGNYKLLGRGKATVPLRITVSSASENAVRKIQNANGEVIIQSRNKK